MVYFANVTDDTTVTVVNQKCHHFGGSNLGYVSCDHCKSTVGYFVHTEEEEDEYGYDEDEDYSDYDEEDIKEMMAPVEDMDEHLKKTFASFPPISHTTGYWSYRYIHLDSVQQYHNRVKGNDADLDLQWSLGSFLKDQQGRYGLDMTTKPPIPYYAYSYVDGQQCDEIHAPRETEVRFQPCDHKNVVSIMSVDETSLWRYVIRICVPSLSPPKSACALLR